MLCAQNDVDLGFDAGLLDGGRPGTSSCLDTTCRTLCSGGCPSDLDIIASRPGVWPWRATEIAGEPCTYDLCGHRVSLANDGVDLDASPAGNCLSTSSEFAGSLVDRLRHGDCDGDGVVNANEYRNELMNYACTRELALVRVNEEARDNDGGEIGQSAEIVQTHTCNAGTDCNTGDICEEQVCVRPSGFSVEICAPDSAVNIDRRATCSRPGYICVAMGPGLNAPPEGATQPRIEIPGLCLPDDILYLSECIGTTLFRGVCGPRGDAYLPAREYIRRGDCDEDGVPNAVDRIDVGGQSVGTGCIPNVTAWVRNANGYTTVRSLPYRPNAVLMPVACESFASPLGDAGPAVPWVAVPIVSTAPRPAVCAPPDVEVLGLAMQPPNVLLGCTHVEDAGTLDQRGLCVYAPPNRPAAALECAYAQLVEGEATGRRQSCFEVSEPSLDDRFHDGDCDEDLVTNLAEALMDAGTPCGNDAGPMVIDAAVEPMDAGRRVDAWAPDTGPEIPQGLFIEGGGFHCHASRGRAGSGPFAALVLGVVMLLRRRGRDAST